MNPKALVSYFAHILVDVAFIYLFYVNRKHMKLKKKIVEFLEMFKLFTMVVLK